MSEFESKFPDSHKNVIARRPKADVAIPSGMSAKSLMRSLRRSAPRDEEFKPDGHVAEAVPRHDGFNSQFMQVAIELAKKAYLDHEVPVGAVIVKRNNGEVISYAKNSMQIQKNPNSHAEILAINAACEKLDNKNLSECDIYITLEPCTMCASAISNARIGRIYYAASDIKQGAVENGVRFFTSSSCLYRPEIYSGMYKEESEALMQSFFSKIRKNKL